MSRVYSLVVTFHSWSKKSSRPRALNTSLLHPERDYGRGCDMQYYQNEEHLLDRRLCIVMRCTYRVFIDISPLSVPILFHHDKLIVELPVTSFYFFHHSHSKWHLDEWCGQYSHIWINRDICTRIEILEIQWCGVESFFFKYWPQLFTNRLDSREEISRIQQRNALDQGGGNLHENSLHPISAEGDMLREK
jgi:hypothetical protein